MYGNKLVDDFIAEYEEIKKEQAATVTPTTKKKNKRKKGKMTSLEARRAVEDLFDLQHYINDIYEEVYDS